MNSKQFVKIIRQVIKEEVAKQVKQQLKEMKLTQNAAKPARKSTSISDLLNDDIDDMSISRSRSSETKYANDPILNDILNETAARHRIPLSDGADDPEYDASTASSWPQMDRNKMAAMLGYGDMVNPGNRKLEQMIPKTDSNGGHQRKSADDIPEHLQKVLMRDYTELVKKMDGK